jgi:hypothetical protein
MKPQRRQESFWILDFGFWILNLITGAKIVSQLSCRRHLCSCRYKFSFSDISEASNCKDPYPDKVGIRRGGQDDFKRK